MSELLPDKKCFIFESIFNPLLPFAVLWGIYTDVMYPNDLRPSENHGYKSKYMR